MGVLLLLRFLDSSENSEAFWAVGHSEVLGVSEQTGKYVWFDSSLAVNWLVT